MDAALKIYQKERLSGYKKGMTAAIYQTAPMSGLVFSFKEIFREIWLWSIGKLNSKQTSSISASGIVITNFLAGICAKTVVYPLDLTKKRLQIQGFDRNKGCYKEIIKCSGVIQCFMLTIKKEGFFGLFKGLFPSLMKAGASSVIYFTTYEYACELLIYAKR